MKEVVGIQHLTGGDTRYYDSNGIRYHIENICVVQTDFGESLGRVVKANQRLETKQFSKDPLKKVLRKATSKDLETYHRNRAKEKDAYRFCVRKAAERKLVMKLIEVEYLLDGKKAIFYFTAENRVDFRELVKDLAQKFKVKIEMRQIGVRDEARRLGGVGCCGRSLCCCTFLKDFVSVSIRMAKDQNLSLNPTKVSGLCGRLMCCLTYEYEGNSDRQKKCKERNSVLAESNYHEQSKKAKPTQHHLPKDSTGTSNQTHPSPTGNEKKGKKIFKHRKFRKNKKSRDEES